MRSARQPAGCRRQACVRRPFCRWPAQAALNPAPCAGSTGGTASCTGTTGWAQVQTRLGRRRSQGSAPARLPGGPASQPREAARSPACAQEGALHQGACQRTAAACAQAGALHQGACWLSQAARHPACPQKGALHQGARPQEGPLHAQGALHEAGRVHQGASTAGAAGARSFARVWHASQCPTWELAPAGRSQSMAGSGVPAWWLGAQTHRCLPC